MGMFSERKPRKRKNVVVTVRNKNNKVTSDFQKLVKTRPNTTSRKSYETPVVINPAENTDSSPE